MHGHSHHDHQQRGHARGGHHGHSGGHGHSHHQGCSHSRGVQITSEEYFAKIDEMKSKNQNQFYWMQILKGTYLEKQLESKGLASLASLNCQVVMGVIGMFHMMLNFQWIPSKAKPFISGLFWPIIGLVILNYNVIVGFNNKDQTRNVNIIIMLAPLVLYALVALRGGGSASSEQNQQKGMRALEIRPYLQNPNLKCAECKIPRIFRTMHCPVCKTCTTKFTRHSLVFGTCIGAANQLLSLFFFLSMAIFCSYSIIKFWTVGEQFGMITKIMFYSINFYLCWSSFVEFCTLFIMNIYYGITEYEAVAWVMLQYLMNVPERSFRNNCDQGLFHNFKESLYALFNIPGFESRKENQNEDKEDSSLLNQEINEVDSLAFPKIQTGKKYVVNWARAFFHVIPHMPNHPLRDNVIKIMQQDEPRMIQNYRLMKSFKKQVERENPGLNEMQINQQAMIKMQQHMMKNGPPKPPPEQQRMIQLQMLGHLKQQFKNDQVLFNQFEEVETKLSKNEIDPEQASIFLREIQHKVMKIKMGQVLDQHKKIEQTCQNKNQEYQGNLLQEQKKQSPQTEKQQAQKEQQGQTKFLLKQGHSQMQPMQISAAQQKAMMLMGLANMKMRFKDDEVISKELQTIQDGLSNDNLSIQAAAVSMQAIQQLIMQKRMKEMANGQQNGHSMMPSPQQQKSMILMGIQQMKARFSNNKEYCQELTIIEKNLQEQKISLEEAKTALSACQQQMIRMMNKS